MKRSAIILAGLAAGVWILAQTVATPPPLPAHFPPGAMLYLEAKDFSGLLRDWNAAPEKAQWLASDNYRTFSRTRLFLRLKDVQSEYAAAAGFAADMPFVSSIAGTESGLAIYDIGEMEFLYISRLPSAKAIEAALFKNRSAYATRNAAGREYFVRTDAATRRTVAFADVDGWLILGTRDNLVGAAVTRIAARQGPSLGEEEWFTRASRAAPRQGELRMAMHFPALLRAPHFRSYWAQRNVSEFRQYLSGMSDVARTSGRIREDRVLVRLQPLEGADTAAAENLLALAPADAGLARAWKSPSAEQILDAVWRKLIHPGPGERMPPSTAAPSVSGIAPAGSEGDLETLVDATTPEIPRNTPDMRPFRELIERMRVDGMLMVQSSRGYADGVFVGNNAAVVLRAGAAWNDAAVRAVLPPGVTVRAQDRILILASDAAAAAGIAAGGAQNASGNAAYAAIYRHSREIEPFTKMMTLIDNAGRAPAEAAPEEEERPPDFFSGNIASLARVLNRVDSAHVLVVENSAARTESVEYRLR